MKRVILLYFILTSISFVAISQQKPLRFRAIEWTVTTTEYNTHGVFKPSSAIIVIDKDDIMIYDDTKNYSYNIIKQLNKYNDQAGNNIYEYSAIDGDGIICTIRQTLIHNIQTEHVMTMFIGYKGSSITYNLKFAK